MKNTWKDMCARDQIAMRNCNMGEATEGGPEGNRVHEHTKVTYSMGSLLCQPDTVAHFVVASVTDA